MATRFYYPSSGAAGISPTFHGSWAVTAEAVRLPLVVGRSGTPMANATVTLASSSEELIRQWVSEPLAAQTISAQTLKIAIRAGSASGLDGRVRYVVRVFASDGTTVRGTLVSYQSLGGIVDDNGTLENRYESVTTTQVVAQANDRIVVEIGGDNDPSTGTFTIRIGDAALQDLPENQTETNDYNPWIEFANDIAFAGGGNGPRSSYYVMAGMR